MVGGPAIAIPLAFIVDGISLSLHLKAMHYVFPNDFMFGTSTAATQIETAFEHDWQGYTSKDGFVFNRTTDHELKFKADAELIASLAPCYRMGPMWSKLQRAPLEALDPATVNEYL